MNTETEEILREPQFPKKSHTELDAQGNLRIRYQSVLIKKDNPFLYDLIKNLYGEKALGCRFKDVEDFPKEDKAWSIPMTMIWRGFVLFEDYMRQKNAEENSNNN